MQKISTHLLEAKERNSFPPVSSARDSGLLAVGGDLSANLILEAYIKGIFPWYDESSPILWWSPDPRCVLIPSELKISRSLQKTLNKNIYNITQNKAFSEVICHCSSIKRPGQDGTWLQPEMIEAYTYLHDLGYAHSVEAWNGERLVGGFYGLMIGKVFFGESMFYLEANASKVAFVHFVKKLIEQGFLLVDCQQTTPHMLSFGAKEISRKEFIIKLQQALEGFL